MVYFVVICLIGGPFSRCQQVLLSAVFSTVRWVLRMLPKSYQVDPAKCRPVVNERCLLKSLFWDLLGKSFRRVLKKIESFAFASQVLFRIYTQHTQYSTPICYSNLHDTLLKSS